MKAKLRLLFLCLFTGFNLSAQNVPIIEVPDEIEFAGMKLIITSGAREILKKDMTAMTKNSKYFYSKVELANLYFPLIEKVFEEESFPKDFKYLALQESSLIADAISKSNAVGYWQFKKESAVEVGLRVDNSIDERMNIISSSRGAARYLKRNNMTFNNWIYSLLSYNLGLGGAKAQINPSNIGVSKMTIDENTHWYVLRFLAHKLVYQNAIGNSSSVDSVLVQYINGANKSMQDIADEYKLDPDKIASFNKWLKSETIPGDKIYPVVLVVPMSQAAVFTIDNNLPSTEKKEEKSKKEKFPTIADIDLKKINSVSYTLVINGVNAIMARNGDNIVKLSAKGDISKSDFLEYNEMKSFNDIIPGRIYYLEHKRKKAMVMFHTVQYGESIWDIAQNYGIKIETIREKNRMDENEAIDPGRVLWLRAKRPKGKMVEYKAIEKPFIIKAKVIEPEQEIIKQEIKREEEPIKTNDNIFVHYDTNPYPYAVDTVRYIYTYHVAASGETLFGISRKYQVTTDSLVKWNSMDGYGIKLGQNLIVGMKEKVERPAEPLYHTVTTGDTFYKIARQYNFTVTELQQVNNKTDMSLKIGEKILIPKR
jgi:membrane-bound lytic murein transglycosylase D